MQLLTKVFSCDAFIPYTFWACTLLKKKSRNKNVLVLMRGRKTGANHQTQHLWCHPSVPSPSGMQPRSRFPLPIDGNRAVSDSRELSLCMSCICTGTETPRVGQSAVRNSSGTRRNAFEKCAGSEDRCDDENARTSV